MQRDDNYECYYFASPNDTRNWFEAQTHCYSMTVDINQPAKLIAINDQEEMVLHAKKIMYRHLCISGYMFGKSNMLNCILLTVSSYNVFVFSVMVVCNYKTLQPRITWDKKKPNFFHLNALHELDYVQLRWNVVYQLTKIMSHTLKKKSSNIFKSW